MLLFNPLNLGLQYICFPQMYNLAPTTPFLASLRSTVVDSQSLKLYVLSVCAHKVPFEINVEITLDPLISYD